MKEKSFGKEWDSIDVLSQPDLTTSSLMTSTFSGRGHNYLIASLAKGLFLAKGRCPKKGAAVCEMLLAVNIHSKQGGVGAPV